MDKNKNYYSELGIDKNSDSKKIKKSYYKLSFEHHPDKGGDQKKFTELSEAYKVLSDDKLRKEYDKKSKYGANYDELSEFLDIEYDYDFNKREQDLENFKKFKINNVYVEVDKDFKGDLKYKRFVKCKKCDGTGSDLSSKIVIRDNDGNIVKTFDADDGCDFCYGTGKMNNKDCTFCLGKGKVGINKCDGCEGEGRILGYQKLKNIKLEDEETKFDTMGHYSKEGVGYLLVKKV